MQDTKNFNLYNAIKGNPSCYFDGHQRCQMEMDKSWVPSVYKDSQGTEKVLKIRSIWFSTSLLHRQLCITRFLWVDYEKPFFVCCDRSCYCHDSCCSPLFFLGKIGYLKLANNVSSELSSQVLSPKSDGWKCLRFWMNSGKSYFPMKVDISYKTLNDSRVVFEYTSITHGWVYFQLPIPKEENTLQVKMPSHLWSSTKWASTAMMISLIHINILI